MVFAHLCLQSGKPVRRWRETGSVQQQVRLRELHITFILLGTSSHSSSKTRMSYKMSLCVPSMLDFGLDTCNLISRTFCDYRNSLRQPSSPCRDIADSVHLNLFTSPTFLPPSLRHCWKETEMRKELAVWQEETFPLFGRMALIPSTHLWRTVKEYECKWKPYLSRSLCFL